MVHGSHERAQTPQSEPTVAGGKEVRAPSELTLPLHPSKTVGASLEPFEGIRPLYIWTILGNEKFVWAETIKRIFYCCAH